MIQLRTSYRTYIVYAICIIIAGLNIYIFAESVTIGDKMLAIENRIEMLRAENQQLEKELYSNTSLQVVEEVAEELGFVQKATPTYLEKPDVAYHLLE